MISEHLLTCSTYNKEDPITNNAINILFMCVGFSFFLNLPRLWTIWLVLFKFQLLRDS